MNSELEILRANLAACGQRIQKLGYSLNKNRALFPMTRHGVENLTDDQEDLSEKSNRDKSLLMEKLGAIKSADEFGTAAVLRNKLSHHYPEEVELRIARFNLVIDEAEFIIATFGDITNYLKRKGFLVK